MKHLPILLLLVLFAGCASQPALQTAPIPSPTTEAAILPEPTPTSAPPTSIRVAVTQPAAAPTSEKPASSPIPGDDQTPTADISEVQIEAGDGLLISGTFYPGNGAPPWPGILLLHMVSGSRGQWDELVPRLIENGYAVLAVDLRGHGFTGDEIDWVKAQEDTLIAWDYLTGLDTVDRTRTALGGASIGANLAMAAASNEAGIKTVVLLSPGLNYFGVTTRQALEAYAQRSLFLAASEEDQYAAESSRALAEAAFGEVELQIFEGAGHGTVMLSREPGLAVSIIDWLERFVK